MSTFRNIFLIWIFTIPLLAVSEPDIKTFMESRINKVTELLQDFNQSKEMRSRQIFDILDHVFDYALISKLSLGKAQWSALSKEEKKEFIEVFQDTLKRSYVEKLSLYTDQKVIVKGTEKAKKSRITLLTDLVGKDEIYAINYKFYKKTKGSDWLIYDVDIVGVSLIKTYRSQFKGIFKDKTFKEVVDKLKKTK